MTSLPTRDQVTVGLSLARTMLSGKLSVATAQTELHRFHMSVVVPLLAGAGTRADHLLGWARDCDGVNLLMELSCSELGGIPCDEFQQTCSDLHSELTG